MHKDQQGMRAKIHVDYLDKRTLTLLCLSVFALYGLIPTTTELPFSFFFSFFSLVFVGNNY